MVVPRSGGHAQELGDRLEAVLRNGGRHDAGPVTVIDDQRVERVLEAKALEFGVGATAVLRPGQRTLVAPKEFQTTDLPRLAAQHDEITALRKELRPTPHAKVRTLPSSLRS
ncbi:hypothetical protein [Streptomyces sp. B1I3]|uniref:hypothetical protein n=1 Tax=Streptomyces sp. B1I3 TaxID=3042264 RepID=UPI0027800861|nr:hypothetical protein [Streptomyces sp. B1I3]MDQ0792170.1 hypothetical protein [Streptomyces sp. B1I3]